MRGKGHKKVEKIGQRKDVAEGEENR